MKIQFSSYCLILRKISLMLHSKRLENGKFFFSFSAFYLMKGNQAMFKKYSGETQEEFDKRMDKRMEILFPTMKQEIKKQKPKNLPLGKSIYDDDVDDDTKPADLKNLKNGESGFDMLLETPKSSTYKKESIKAKSGKETGEDEKDEYLSDLYPSMKDLIREKKEKREKKGNFTGAGADENKSQPDDVEKSGGKKTKTKAKEGNSTGAAANQTQDSFNEIYGKDDKNENTKINSDKIAKLDLNNSGLEQQNLKNNQSKFAVDEIAGVKRGESKSLDETFKNVNPGYQPHGNLNKRTNCQTAVIAADLQTRGYDVEASIDYSSPIKDKVSQRPNIAYIDPRTGKNPEFIVSNATNKDGCEQWLNDNIKQGEKHLFAFQWENSKTGHIVIVTKDSNDELKIYDCQNSHKYNNAKELLSKLKYNFSFGEDKYPPKLLRVDDKEPNPKIVNQILKQKK